MIAAMIMAFALGGGAGMGAGEAPDPECVKRVDCRFVGPVTIHTDQGDKHPALNRNMPFIRTMNGQQRLWLVLGERVVIRVDDAGGAPVVVEKGSAEDKLADDKGRHDLVEISLNQAPGSTMTLLTVHNFYKRTLKYKAHLMFANGSEAPTSICPVLPGLSSFENWHEPRIEIALSDFHLDDSKDIVCQ